MLKWPTVKHLNECHEYLRALIKTRASRAPLVCVLFIVECPPRLVMPSLTTQHVEGETRCPAASPQSPRDSERDTGRGASTGRSASKVLYP